MNNQQMSEDRKYSNIASAILIANNTNTADKLEALKAHLSRATVSDALKQYDDIAFALSLSSTATTNFTHLHNNDIIKAYVHIIQNPDKFRSNRERKQYFLSLLAPSIQVEKEEVATIEAPKAAIEHKQVVNVEPEIVAESPIIEPPYFDPGRYADISNEDYHRSNGISSSMVKDGRISLMYYQRRHVTKVILREKKRCFDLGSAFHTLTMEPEKFDAEFSIRPSIPEGAFTNVDSMKKWIDEHNAGLPQPLNADELKAAIDTYNSTLPTPLPLSGSVEEIGGLYADLAEEFRKIPESDKHTSAAMKACIKEFNATLPTPLKTSGSRDQLLEQLEKINTELVTSERNKPEPLRKPVKKDELIQIIKSVNPNAIFEDELINQWRQDDSKIQVETADYTMASNMRDAVMQHSEASKLINHPNRVSEVSYYGIDEDTGLEIRVRPDIEIQIADDHRLGFDLKSVSLGRFKQEAIESMIRREILNRDYHVSAAMYSDVAMLDQFFWIFVNTDENYHWVAIVEASPELLELGRLEYKQTLRDINQAMETNYWPAPITTTITIGLSDFDTRKLEALQSNAA